MIINMLDVSIFIVNYLLQSMLPCAQISIEIASINHNSLDAEFIFGLLLKSRKSLSVVFPFTNLAQMELIIGLISKNSSSKLVKSSQPTPAWHKAYTFIHEYACCGTPALFSEI